MEMSFTFDRDTLIEDLRSEIDDERVLEAMRRVPREEFVPPELRRFSYEDRPLPIGHGQTISQPLMVATMTAVLSLQGDEKTLELGTGSGYPTAILAELSREVVSVERVPELAAMAARCLNELGYRNVRVYTTGPTLGRPEDAPYDAILVTAGAPHIPQPLVDQLAMGGRLVIPVGERHLQTLLSVVKRKEGVSVTRHGQCRFVPLIGEGAWPPEAATEY